MSDSTITLQHVQRLFLALHAFYGNLVLDKFRTGDLDPSGRDRGVVSTQAMWLQVLSEFDADTLQRALPMCADRHKTFPPTLPEFRDICRAVLPRHAIHPERKRISDSDRSKATVATREAIAMLRADLTGQSEVGSGYQTLLAMVAHAHGLAGGDEAEMLARLERRDG